MRTRRHRRPCRSARPCPLPVLAYLRRQGRPGLERRRLSCSNSPWPSIHTS